MKHHSARSNVPTMIRIEGTIKTVIFKNTANSTPYLIACISAEDNVEKKIKGSCTLYPQVGDYIIGNFKVCETRLQSRFIQGDEYESNGLIDVLPPRTDEAINTRCKAIAKQHDIRFTGKLETCLADVLHKSISEDSGDFWAYLKTCKPPSDAPAGFDAFKKAVDTFNKQYTNGVPSALEIETYFSSIGITWSSKVIRKITGHDEDSENPDRIPISLVALKEDPLVLLESPKINLKQVEQYLSALLTTGAIDSCTFEVGLLIKAVMFAESQEQHTSIPFPEDKDHLCENRLFKRYLTTYTIPKTGEMRLYRKQTLDNEKTIAKFVAEQLESAPHSYLEKEACETQIESMPPDNGRIPNKKQRLSVYSMYTQRLMLLQGGAGTGKTTSLRLLVRYHKRYYPDYASNILFLAPTGKAVQRIKDSLCEDELVTAESGFLDNVLTIHRFAALVELYMRHKDSEKPVDDKRFEIPQWVESTPEMVVMDECSMIDTATMAMFVNAIRRLRSLNKEPLPHVVMIGDDAQLPPIGCGQPFMDLLRLGYIPTVELDVIHRQTGDTALTSAIAAIRGCEEISRVDETFKMKRFNADTLTHDVVSWLDVTDSSKNNNVIIVPTNELAEKITFIARKHLNPESPTNAIISPITKKPIDFRIGDKVMQIKNNYGLNVFNGTVGVITRVGDIKKTVEDAKLGKQTINIPHIWVRFAGKEMECEYTFEKAHEELKHAYALTVHKAQGSEYDNTLLVFEKTIRGFINRNLVYTAASRGKKSVSVFTNNTSCWKDSLAHRYTGLQTHIEELVEFE